MGKLIDTGTRYGKLVVLSRAENYVSPKGGRLSQWRCKCDCGNETVVLGTNLRKGITKSCGCLRKTRASELCTTHGLSNRRLFNIWCGMKKRCYNQNHKFYAYYGGRGITVCDEWLHDFQAFWDWAMSNGYQDDLSIERANNSLGYTPENCRWATAKEQNRNTRQNRRITINGETKTLAEWCEQCGLKYGTVYDRFRCGWTPEEALELVPRKKS